MAGPNSSIAIRVDARGVLEAAPKTAANPTAPRRFDEMGSHWESALPRVVPMKTRGINSPPLNPDASVKTVKINLKKTSRKAPG